MNIEKQLTSLGLDLPQTSAPGGNYSSVNIRGNMVYVAIQFPILNEQYLYQGRLGNEISTEQGYKAMELSRPLPGLPNKKNLLTSCVKLAIDSVKSKDNGQSGK